MRQECTLILKQEQLVTVMVKYPSILLVITQISNVDGAVSGKIRVTAIPNSNDIIPVRNQILELDTTNTTVTGSV